MAPRESCPATSQEQSDLVRLGFVAGVQPRFADDEQLAIGADSRGEQLPALPQAMATIPAIS